MHSKVVDPLFIYSFYYFGWRESGSNKYMLLTPVGGTCTSFPYVTERGAINPSSGKSQPLLDLILCRYGLMEGGKLTSGICMYAHFWLSILLLDSICNYIGHFFLQSEQSGLFDMQKPNRPIVAGVLHGYTNGGGGGAFIMHRNQTKSRFRALSH